MIRKCGKTSLNGLRGPNNDNPALSTETSATERPLDGRCQCSQARHNGHKVTTHTRQPPEVLSPDSSHSLPLLPTERGAVAEAIDVPGTNTQ